jgi:AcrR family transcriptional regulator
MPRAEREQLILDVAGGIFAGSGYHSASMDEIAERAGVSKPMLYTYFGSKEGLYVAYIHRTGRSLIDRLQDAAQREAPPQHGLRARIGEFMAFVEEHRDGWKVLFGEANSNGPVAAEVADLRRRIAGAVRRMVETSVAVPEDLSATAVDGVAHAIVGAGESLANWWLEHPAVSREEVVDLYVDVVQGAVPAVLHRRQPADQ